MPLIWRKDAVKDCDGDREFVHRMGIGSTNSASIKNLTEISYFSLPNPKNWFLVKNTPNKLLRDLIDWDPSKRGFSPLICKSTRTFVTVPQRHERADCHLGGCLAPEGWLEQNRTVWIACRTQR